jgi:hypothetical protein
MLKKMQTMTEVYESAREHHHHQPAKKAKRDKDDGGDCAFFFLNVLKGLRLFQAKNSRPPS